MAGKKMREANEFRANLESIVTGTAVGRRASFSREAVTLHISNSLKRYNRGDFKHEYLFA